MKIDRCICFDVLFSRLKAFAVQHDGCDLEQIRRHFGCGRGCGLCVPYIRQMLETGRTTFDFIITDPSDGEV